MSVPETTYPIFHSIVKKAESYVLSFTGLLSKSRHNTLITVLNDRKRYLLLLVAIL
jgi:hypothetical protein